MTPKVPFLEGTFLGQTLAAPSPPGAFVYSRNSTESLKFPKNQGARGIHAISQR